MPETQHIDGTPLQVSDQNGKGPCDKQTTLEQALEFDCGSGCNEASEQKPKALLNEQGEIERAKSGSDDKEELQLLSEDVTKVLVSEHFDPLSEDIDYRHTGIKSCDEQTNSVNEYELGFRRVFSGSPEHNHRPCSELLPSLLVETGDIEQMVQDSDYKTKVSLTKQLELPPVDVSRSSLVETDSGPKIITEQGCGVGSESTPSEPSKTKYQLSPEPAQNEIEETSSALSECATVEQLGSSPETLMISSFIEGTGVPLEGAASSEKLASPSEDKTKDSLTAQLEVPPVNVLSSNLAETGSCPQQSLEQRHELGSESVHSEPTEQENQITPETEPFKSETLEFCNISGCVAVEQLEPPAEVPTNNSLCENKEVSPDDVTKTSSPEKLARPENAVKGSSSESVHNEPTEQENQITPETEPFKSETLEICHVSGCVAVEQLEPVAEVPTNNPRCVNKEVLPDDVTKTSSPEKLARPENAVKDSSFEELETPHKNTVDCFSLSGSPEKKSPKVLKKKHRVKHLVDTNRVLRPRSQEKPKPPESSTNLVNASTETKGEKKKRKQRVSSVTADEFLRIRQRLRYFQNKINYERTLIDAYSGEGWKGLSMEKLRPEKELQRAASEILRQKLRIRDLFQHIESLCAEGKIPESLFDSEGEIDCEDIFCAKCGSTDVSLDNDILLCDGACERAFHQFCLEPPLRKEDIPPGDEGWLCPGCDCKFDCIDLLNESQGTNLSLNDSWEKVFPEAAPTAGQSQDPNFGLPSDDSEDDDYDPDGSERDEKVQEDASSSSESSDESQYTTASDDLEKPANEEQFLGLPSDDSEDDDFDPSARDHDDKVKHESSGSDFTSDSEDLVAVLNDGVSSGKDGDSACSSLGTIKSRRGSDGRKSNVGRKKPFVNEELSPLLESKLGEEGAVRASGKRHVERLDYKKLHDEEYGNDSTDSSDDEIWNAKETHDKASSDSSDDDDDDDDDIGGDNWADTETQRKRKKTTGEVTPVASNGTAPSLKHKTKAKDITGDNLIEPKHTSRKRSRQKMNSEDANGSPSTPVKGPLTSGSSDKKARSSTARRLGEATIQELHKSFKENQYPDVATRETLATRLELTFQQVSKWFNNTRWHTRHSACVEPCSTSCLAKHSRRNTPLSEKNDKPPEPGPEPVATNETPKISTVAPECSGGDTRGADKESPGSRVKDSRKRKGKGKLADAKDSGKNKGKGKLADAKDSGKNKGKGKLADAKDSGKKKKRKSVNVESRNNPIVEVVHALRADFPKPGEEPRGSKIQKRSRKSTG